MVTVSNPGILPQSFLEFYVGRQAAQPSLGARLLLHFTLCWQGGASAKPWLPGHRLSEFYPGTILGWEGFGFTENRLCMY